MKGLIRVGVLGVTAWLAGADVAHGQVIRWIDKLSGPGPFTGIAVDQRVVCWGEPPSKAPNTQAAARRADEESADSWCLVDRVPQGSRRRYSLRVEAGVLWARDNHLPYNRDLTEDDRRVKLTPLQVAFHWEPLRGLELGHGAGVFFFSGRADLFERFTRFAIEPLRLDVRPFELALRDQTSRDALSSKLLRMITLRQSVVFLPKGVTAADFNALGSFRTERELLPSYSLVLDIEPFLSRKR